MTVIKIVGIALGAFLLLGIAFIEPTKNMQDQGLRELIITGGGIVCGTLAAVAIRKVTRSSTRQR